MQKLFKFVSHQKIQAVLLFFISIFLYNWAYYFLAILTGNYHYPLYIWTDFITFLLIVLLAYKSGAFSKSLSTFEPKNLMIFVVFIILGLGIVYFLNRIYFETIPALDAVPEHATDLGNFLYSIPRWNEYVELFVLAPICEELIFREYLFRIFKWKWLAFIISMLTFVWIHTHTLFNITVLYYLPMAFVLCLIYQRKKIVTESIVMHMVLNIVIAFIPAFTMYMNGV